MSGLRGLPFGLIVALISIACGRGEVPAAGPPGVAPGVHAETWYGWELLLPDGCEAPAEERFDGAAIGRAQWVCPGLVITLDASPLADPLHHTAPLRFRSGAALCGDSSAVERTRLPEDAPPPSAEVTYYEPVLGHALAVRREASERAASLVVLGDPSRCEDMAQIVQSLRSQGPRLDAPRDELRTPSFALPLPDAGCHRHFVWAQCKPGGAGDVHVRCDELRVDWWARSLISDGPSSPAATSGAAGRLAYVREPSPDREGVARWRVDVAGGTLVVEGSEAREGDVLAALARARVEPALGTK